MILCKNYKIFQFREINKRCITYSLDNNFNENEINYDLYHKTYESELYYESDKNSSLEEILEKIFVKHNIYRPEDFNSYSLSIGDLIEIEKRLFIVMSIGFKEIHNYKLEIKNILERK